MSKPRKTANTAPKGNEAATIKIACSYTNLEPPENLKPHPRNPNSHPAYQIDLLVKIIESTGFRSPVVVSKRSGFVIKGHGRLKAALQAKWNVVPVDYQDYQTEAEEYADMVADNRL